MPQFHYEAFDTTRRQESGYVSANSEEDAVEQLHQRGLTILTLTQEETAPSEKEEEAPSFNFNIRLGKLKPKISNLLLFTNQLATMLEAGLPLLQILKNLTQEVEDPALQEVLPEIVTRIENGSSFSEALREYPHIFSRLFVNLANAGEISGQQDVVLHQLATYLEEEHEFRQNLKSALAYPVFVISFACLAVAALVLFIIPIFQDIFSQFDAELPAMTQIVINISDFVRGNFVLVLLGLVGSVIALYFGGKTDPGKRIIDSIMLKVPIFGPLIEKTMLSRISRTFSVLVGNGITVIDSLNIVKEIIENIHYHDLLADAAHDIQEGLTISKALRKSGRLPGMLIQMVDAGEESGNLEKMLEKAAEFYEKQVRAIIGALSSMLEPVILVLVGGVIGFVVIAMFLPIFNLGTAIGG